MPNYPIGTLDRSAKLYSVQSSQGAGGVVVNTPVFLGNLYCRKVTTSAAAVMASGRAAVDIEDQFICRYVVGLQAEYLINVEGTLYRIVKAEELGRREGWRIWCRAVT